MKKGMKKGIAVTLAVVTTLSMLTGCSGKTKPSTTDPTATPAGQKTEETAKPADPTKNPDVVDMGGITIRVANMATWTPDEEVLPDATSDTPILAYAAQLEEKYNCKIVFVGQNFDTIQNSIATGNPDADIIADMGPGNTINYISANLYYPLSDAGIDLDYPSYDKALIEMTTKDGKVYGLRGVPCEDEPPVGAAVCFFNKSMMDREGIEDLYALQESGNWTWDKFEEIMSKVTKDTDGDGIMNQVGMVGTSPLVFANTNGAQKIKGEGENLTFGMNTPEAIEAFERTNSWVEKKYVYMPTAEEDWNTPQLKFIAGESAFYIDPLQRIWPVNSASMADDYGVLFLPKGPKAKDYVITNDWWEGYGVVSTSEHPVEASIILAELCKTDSYGDQDWFDATYGPVVRDEESLATINKLYGKTLTVVDAAYGDAFGGDDGFGTIVGNIMNGSETASVGMQKAEPLVNAKLKQIIESRKTAQ